MSFEIENVSDLDLKPTLISYPSELFDVELPDKIKAGKSEKAKIVLKEDALDVTYDKSFTIEFNDEAKTRFSIPVRRALRVP